MMGPVKGNDVDVRRFALMKPSRVMYDFDGPRTFTFLDAEAELNLALWFDESPQLVRYLVVPFTEELVARLETRQISVRDALAQPRLWVVDVDNSGNPVAAVRTSLAELPQEELPAPGTMLLSSLEPLLPLGSPEQQTVDLEGRVRELDKDRLSFELREITGARNTQKFVFAEELFDDVFQAFQEDKRVKVAGRTFPVKNLAYAYAISTTT